MTIDAREWATWVQAVEMMPEHIYSAFTPEEAKRLREVNGLSRESAARILGISVYTLADVEAGRYHLRERGRQYNKLLNLLEQRARNLAPTDDEVIGV